MRFSCFFRIVWDGSPRAHSWGGVVTLPARDEPEARAHALVERVALLLEQCHALRRQLEVPRELVEAASAEALRLLYFAVTGTLEAALVRAMADVLTVLRHASQPLGPMGAEWLDRQDRALKRDDDFTHATNSSGPQGVADVNPSRLEPLKLYALSTVIPAVCIGCLARSTRPGRDGWSWRWKPSPKGQRGRATESWCPECSCGPV